MNKVYKSFSIVTGIAIATRLLSFLFKIFLSRKLGAEVLGLYQISFSILVLLACFATSGIPVTLSRITAECCSIGNIKKLNSVFTSSLVLALILCALPTCVILFFPSLLKYIFSDDRCAKLLVIMLPMLFTTALYSIIRSWFWGKKSFNIFAFSELLDEVIKIIITIILFAIATSFIENTYIYAIAMIVGDVFVLSYLIYKFFSQGGKLADPLHFREVIKSSTPITTSRLLAAILSSFMSLILPALLVSDFNLSTAEATAEYGRASGMVMSLIFAPNAILGSLGVILIPEIATLATKNDIEGLKRKLSYSLFIAVIITCFFMIFFIGIGNELGYFLYKDEYVGKYLSFGAIMMVPMGVNGILNSMLNSIKKELHSFYSYVISSVFLVAIIYFTPKYLGIYSYFLALIVFHFINTTINLYIINKEIPIETNKIVFGCSIVAMAIALSYTLKHIATLILLPLILKIIVLVLIGLVIIAIIGIPFYLYFGRKSPHLSLQ